MSTVSVGVPTLTVELAGADCPLEEVGLGAGVGAGSVCATTGGEFAPVLCEPLVVTVGDDAGLVLEPAEVVEPVELVEAPTDGAEDAPLGLLLPLVLGAEAALV